MLALKIGYFKLEIPVYVRFSAKGGQLSTVCLTAVHPSAHSIERVSWASRALCTGDGASSVMKGEWGWGCEWVLGGVV